MESSKERRKISLPEASRTAQLIEAGLVADRQSIELIFFTIVFFYFFLVPGIAQQPIQFPEYRPPSGNPWNPPLNASSAPLFGPSNASAPWPSSSGSLGSAGTGPIYGPATITPLGPPVPSSSFGATVRPNSSPLLPPTSNGLAATSSPWGLGNMFGGPANTSPPWNGFGSNSSVFPTLPNNYPSSVYPNASPPALFPNSYGSSSSNAFGTPPGQGTLFPNSFFNGNNWRQSSGWFNGSGWNLGDFGNAGPTGPLWNGSLPMPSRFFVTPRLRHTWVGGDDQADSLGINDTDASLVFQIPGFLGSTQPLYIVPSYSMHLWDGPSHPMADLPASAYSGFLDFGWESNPLRTFGLELGTRVGVFSDFNTFNSESLRILGKILGRVRLTPTATVRIGAFWINRNRIKLIPAAGVLWVPNADTRFDIFFPEPKLSHYLATLGRSDMWWYVSGYYGGGAWTIERADGSSDNVDINDMRVVLGLEFGRNELLRQGHRFAFVEGGYVFNRELIYRVHPDDNLELDDSFMIRAGFVY